VSTKVCAALARAKHPAAFTFIEQASSIQGLVNPLLGEEATTTHIAVIKLIPYVAMILPVLRAKYQHKELTIKLGEIRFDLARHF
jgi:hypothetical protein